MQVRGSDVLFSSEEKEESWCGAPGRACVDCTRAVVGRDRDSKCADRLMTTSLAEKIAELSRLVRTMWPKRDYEIYLVICC